MDRRVNSGLATAAGKAGVEWSIAGQALSAPSRLNLLRSQLGDAKWAFSLGAEAVRMGRELNRNPDHAAVFQYSLEQLQPQFREAATHPGLSVNLVFGMVETFLETEPGEHAIIEGLHLPADSAGRRTFAYEMLQRLGFNSERKPLGNPLAISRDVAA